MLTHFPLSRNSQPGAGGPSRQLYMLLREVPNRAEAMAYLQRRLAEAAALHPAWSGGLTGLEDWHELRARTQAEEFRLYLAGRSEGGTRRHFATLAQARRFLCMQAPLLLAEGAWLHSVLDHWRQPAYMPLVKLYLDYLGKGVPAANHVAQIQHALSAQSCSNWQELEDSGYVQAAIRLALACAGERYLPELLGYQLAVPDQPASQFSVLHELGELGIVLPPPLPDGLVLTALRTMLGNVEDRPAFLQRLEVGHALGRLGLQTVPATASEGAQYEEATSKVTPAVFAPPANGAAHADAVAEGDVEDTGGSAPRGILRHDFPRDEHAWEIISSDLGLLEAQIAACASKAQAMTMLARHMGPAVHHQPLGLMAARVYSQLFALG